VVADEHVDMAERLHGGRHHLIWRVRVEEVGLQVLDPPSDRVVGGGRTGGRCE
jgi:hypothetical protein